MKRLRALIVVGAFAAAASACGSNPLVGNWSASISPQTDSTLNFVVGLNASGTLTYNLTGTGMCSGSLAYSGFNWTSTATALTTTGTAVCTGAGITCPGSAGMLTCGSSGPTPTMCTYALSNNNMTLTLSGCTNGAEVLNTAFTRTN